MGGKIVSFSLYLTCLELSILMLAVKEGLGWIQATPKCFWSSQADRDWIKKSRTISSSLVESNKEKSLPRYGMIQSLDRKKYSANVIWLIGKVIFTLASLVLTPTFENGFTRTSAWNFIVLFFWTRQLIKDLWTHRECTTSCVLVSEHTMRQCVGFFSAHLESGHAF